MTTKRKVRKRVPANRESIIRVAVMGQTVKEIAVTTDTLVRDVASALNLDYRSVKGSRTGNTNFSVLGSDDNVNGYKSLLFIPGVSGGQ